MSSSFDSTTALYQAGGIALTILLVYLFYRFLIKKK